MGIINLNQEDYTDLLLKVELLETEMETLMELLQISETGLSM